MRIGNDTITLSGNNMAVNITSDPIWLGHIANFSIQIVFTGTPTGQFKLQMSNDDGRPSASTEAARDYQVNNFTDIVGSQQQITEAGNHGYTVQNTGYRWVRLVYTAGSGSGTITTTRFNVKGV